MYSCIQRLQRLQTQSFVKGKELLTIETNEKSGGNIMADNIMDCSTKAAIIVSHCNPGSVHSNVCVCRGGGGWEVWGCVCVWIDWMFQGVCLKYTCRSPTTVEYCIQITMTFSDVDYTYVTMP